MKKILIVISSLMFLVACNINQSEDKPAQEAQPVQTQPAKEEKATKPPVAEKPNNVSTYSNSEFSFQYPDGLVVKENVDLAAGKGLQVNGLEAYTPNTNLNSADIEITSGDAASCKDANLFGSSLAAGVSTVVNGITFQLDTYQDAGAGHRADSTVYSVIHNSKCYRIALVTQYSVLENYEKPPKAFDKVKLQAVLEALVKSFEFKK